VVAAQISKVARSGDFHTAGMVWWRSSTAEEDQEGGNYDSGPGRNEIGLQMVDLRF
jgi:hypothetical protein